MVCSRKCPKIASPLQGSVHLRVFDQPKLLSLSLSPSDVLVRRSLWMLSCCVCLTMVLFFSGRHIGGRAHPLMLLSSQDSQQQDGSRRVSSWITDDRCSTLQELQAKCCPRREDFPVVSKLLVMLLTEITSEAKPLWAPCEADMYRDELQQWRLDPVFLMPCLQDLESRK